MKAMLSSDTRCGQERRGGSSLLSAARDALVAGGGGGGFLLGLGIVVLGRTSEARETGSNACPNGPPVLPPGLRGQQIALDREIGGRPRLGNRGRDRLGSAVVCRSGGTGEQEVVEQRVAVLGRLHGLLDLLVPTSPDRVVLAPLRGHVLGRVEEHRRLRQPLVADCRDLRRSTVGSAQRIDDALVVERHLANGLLAVRAGALALARDQRAALAA